MSEERVSVRVKPGQTVRYGGRTHRAGYELQVTKAEAERLDQLGYIEPLPGGGHVTATGFRAEAGAHSQPGGGDAPTAQSVGEAAQGLFDTLHEGLREAREASDELADTAEQYGKPNDDGPEDTE